MTLISRQTARRVLEKLAQAYPDARCALNHKNAFELLIATILSAQSTDARVNKVTEGLFQKYRTPEDYASLTPEILQEDIKELGLYRSKAENIVAACRILMEQYGGQVPVSREELMKLPGVGRKTANVVLSVAFGVPALAVDTHVSRVANRIGLADSDNPLQIEQQVCSLVPKKLWSNAHHWLIHHGRRVCTARKPQCDSCPLQAECRYYKQEQKKAGKRPASSA
ncbi:MAG: endonuclease III [Alicyclobacillus herbarius]|uniref:endonuclease III n=1 Tax=Alicyclobacillus herbarius TaxID=122960 RepID=UPI002354EE1F|nr:endonuclease III [Alicyclobacillus herbarius]MCL6631364.1 endonuclease III [Alicyclobacillus herbarius]